MPNALTGTPGPSETAGLVLEVLAALSAFFVAALLLLNTDHASRYLLGPVRVLARRTRSSKYRFEKAIFSSKENYKDTAKVLNITYLETLVSAIMDTLTVPEIVGIQRDEKDFEFYLLLDCSEVIEFAEFDVIRVPIVTFCKMLLSRLDKLELSESMCFVADASAGLGPIILTKCLNASTDVAVLTPMWMAALAFIIEQDKSTAESLDIILKALCKMEVKRVKDLEQIPKSRTVLFNLPGQAVVPVLLPALQRIFPCQRHIFVYDACESSVNRSLALASKEEYNLYCPASTQAAIGSSMAKNVTNYSKRLTELPEAIANSVVSWMASVDTYLILKANEKKNEYSPFVLRLEYLLAQSEGNEISNVCLRKVMEFVMGSGSRPLLEETLKSSRSTLRSVREGQPNSEFVDTVVLSESSKVAIKRCVSCHQGIQFGDSILIGSFKPTNN